MHRYPVAVSDFRRQGRRCDNTLTYFASCLSSSLADPLLPLSFLHHLHSVLLMYFPTASTSTTLSASPNSPTPIPASVLATNFDLVYQLLQEMLDDGRPLTVEYNSLKGIVRGRAWWEDIMARMGR